MGSARRIAAIARVYADFRASNTAGPPVNLPAAVVNGAYVFNISVQAGQTYYIDPAVAIGYDYRIGVGDPSFMSVVLPTGIGDGLYDIFGLGLHLDAGLLYGGGGNLLGVFAGPGFKARLLEQQGQRDADGGVVVVVDDQDAGFSVSCHRGVVGPSEAMLGPVRPGYS